MIQRCNAHLSIGRPSSRSYPCYSILYPNIDRSTHREELFAYPIDWEVLDRHDIVRGPMQQWVTKKIAEYLGGVEEDDSLTEFIIGNGWMYRSMDGLDR